MSEITPPGSWPGLGEHGESVLGPDPLKAARDLQGALEGMTKQLAAVKKTVRRGKKVIIALVVSLIIDVGLTVIVSITAVQAHHASTQASATVGQLHALQISSCQAGNQTRAQEILLWTHLAQIAAPSPHLTKTQLAANKREVAQLLAYIKMTFAPRQCRDLYRLPGGTP